MSDRDAPRVFVSYSHDSQQHKMAVLELATFLRTEIGLDVRLDLWDDGPRRDWSEWAIEQLARADFVLVIASPEYRRRTNWDAQDDVGWGARFEAAIIRNNLTRNLRRETERVLPVLLPGRTIEDIPAFLNGHSTTWFSVPETTRTGVADLLAAITGQGQYPLPDRGTWQAAPTPEVAPGRTLLAAGMPWAASSTGVRPQSASIGGDHYPHSIVFRPSAPVIGVLDVDLGGRFQWFTSAVGVLDDAEAFQVGLFRVLADCVPLAERRVTRHEADTIDLDVGGVTRLRLEMSRPGSATGPLHTGGLPALGWGDPTLVG